MKGIRWLLLGIGIVVLPACIPIDFFVPWSIQKHYNTVAPPESVTSGALISAYRRTRLYWKEHGRVPESIDQLPLEEGRANGVTDGWGHPLIWEKRGDQAVKISSFGKDGVLGGEGEDASYSITFDGTKMTDQDNYTFPEVVIE